VSVFIIARHRICSVTIYPVSFSILISATDMNCLIFKVLRPVAFTLVGLLGTITQAAIIVSGPATATASVSTNSCTGTGPRALSVASTTSTYDIFVGNTNRLCDPSNNTGAQFASAVGNPSAGTFAVTSVVSRFPDRQLGDSWDSISRSITNFTLVNNGPTSQAISATNSIDAGAVLTHAVIPALVNPYSFVEDLSAKVEFRLLLDGVMLNSGTVRFARSTALDFETRTPVISYRFNKTGIFSGVSEEVFRPVTNAFGNNWWGLTWDDFNVTTNLGSLAPSESKVLSIEIIAIARAIVSADINRGVLGGIQLAEVYASLGDPLALASPSFPTFTVIGGNPEVPPSQVPVAPTSLLVLLGFSAMVAYRGKIALSNNFLLRSGLFA
jgi:hypothetical protein